MKSAKKYLEEKFESLGKIQEGVEGDMDGSAFEHIAEQVKKGYVEGELNHEDDNGKTTRGWWKIKIEKDDQDEELRLEEIARIIATGVKHGYNLTFDLNTEWFIEEKRLTPQEIEAQQDEDDEGVEKIERPKGSLRKGERFEEGKVYNEAFIAKTERWLDQTFLGE